MGIEQSGGTDTRAEDADKPQAPERPPGPPPDRPGQPGFPSRIESRRAAREAQEARAAELASRQAAPPESGTQQPDAKEETAAESSPAEPTGEQQDPQDAQKPAETSEAETGSGLDERDAAPSEPEGGEASRPEEPDEQPGTTDTDELVPETDAEPPEDPQDEDVEPPSAEAAENQEEPAEAGAAEDPPDDDSEASQAARPDGQGDESHAQDADDAAPRPPGERDQSEARDRQPLARQDGRSPRTSFNGPGTTAGQIFQTERLATGHEQAPQGSPGPVPSELTDASPEIREPATPWTISIADQVGRTDADDSANDRGEAAAVQEKAAQEQTQAIESNRPEGWLDRPNRPPTLETTRPYDQAGGLTRPDPHHQRDVEDTVPKLPDGNPEPFPDPRDRWSSLVNDGGPTADPLRGNNCLDCSLSLISTWHGEPAVSAPRYPDRQPDGSLDRWTGESGGMKRAERWLDHEYEHLGAPTQGFQSIEDKLRAGGHGSAANIVNTWRTGGAHAWNAVNYNGEVLWVDSQTSKVDHKPLYATGRIGDVWAVVIDKEGKAL